MAELNSDIREIVRERYANAAKASAAGNDAQAAVHEYASSAIIRARKPSSCCTPKAQEICCEPSAKSECCRSVQHAADTCGCGGVS
jgi:hypothetical protein